MNRYFSLLRLVALCLPVTIACVDIMALSVAIDVIMTQFSASVSESQWLISAYTIGTASFLILVGKLADLYGRRRILLLGIILFGIASLLAGFAPSMALLIVARFLQGVASSIMMTTVISIIVHQFAAEERTHVLSKWALSLAVGMALGPLVAAAVLYFASWRFIFFINAPICIMAYFLAVKYIPESKDETGKIKIHWGEALLLSLTLILFVAFFSEGESLGWRSPLMLSLSAAFLITLFAYGVLFYTRGSTLLDLSLFKLKYYGEGSACGFLSYFCMYAWLFIFALYLQQVCGMSPLHTGLMFIAYAIASAVCSQFMSKIIKRWGKQRPIQVGFSLGIAAFLWMSHINALTPLWQLLIMSFLPGMMLTLVNIPSMSLAMSAIPPEKTGIASGVVFTIRWLGGSLGVAIITLIYESSTYLKTATPLSAACFGMAFFAAIGLCLTMLIKTPKTAA